MIFYRSVAGMEATRERTRQGLSEDPNTRRTTRAKVVEGNPYIALSGGTIEEGEDDVSEFEPTATNTGRAKTLGAPSARRVLKPPRTPIRASSQIRAKATAAKDTAKNEGISGLVGLTKAFL